METISNIYGFLYICFYNIMMYLLGYKNLHEVVALA